MISSFLKYLQFERRYSKHTIASYQTDLQQFDSFLSKEVFTKVSDINYQQIRSWIISLVENGISPNSVNRKIATLRSYFKFLLQRGEIVNDPTQRLQALKTAKRLPEFVQETDLNRLFDHHGFPEGFSGIRDRLILEILYGTGIRRDELVGLTDSSISMTMKQMKVRGKRDKERIIPLNNSLIAVLEQYNEARQSTFPRVTNGALILTDKGNSCYPVFVYRVVTKYLGKASSMKKRSPHVLRHTFATHLLNHGADLNAVKDLLGHTSLAATQIYTHNSLEKLKNVFNKAHPKA